MEPNDWKRQQKEDTKKQLQEINQRMLTKECRLKRYRYSLKQYKQNRTNERQKKILSTVTGGKRNKTILKENMEKEQT